MFRQSEVLINETEYSQNEELANIISIEDSAIVKNVDMNIILDLFEKNVSLYNKIKIKQLKIFRFKSNYPDSFDTLF